MRKVKLGHSEELAAIRRLDGQARQVERRASGPYIEALLADERAATRQCATRDDAGQAGRAMPDRAVARLEEVILHIVALRGWVRIARQHLGETLHTDHGRRIFADWEPDLGSVCGGLRIIQSTSAAHPGGTPPARPATPVPRMRSGRTAP